MDFTEEEKQSLKNLANTNDGRILIGYFKRVHEELRKIPSEGQFDKDQLFEIVTSNVKAGNILMGIVKRLEFHQEEPKEKGKGEKKKIDNINRQYN